MDEKTQLLKALRTVRQDWQTELSSFSEAQLNAPQLPGNWSIKDVIGHLRAWQQRSIARVEAALEEREPDYAGWPVGIDPEADEHIERINAWIYDTYHAQPWASVYRDWHDGFARFLALSERVPAATLSAAGRYAWLDGYALAAVLQGSYEHHQEHLDLLRDWLRARR